MNKHFQALNAIELLAEFESNTQLQQTYSSSLEGFRLWLGEQTTLTSTMESDWEAKENGRSAESIITTRLVHLNRYAKSYSKAAILDSDFATQDEFIYLINLNAKGAMGKMELIKRNVHQKPAGMLIITRLLQNGWIEQQDSKTDRRSKVIEITEEGKKILENQMGKIRQATNIVSGDLTKLEKNQLISLLNKLSDFHKPIYQKNIKPEVLLDTVDNEFLK